MLTTKRERKARSKKSSAEQSLHLSLLPTLVRDVSNIRIAGSWTKSADLG